MRIRSKLVDLYHNTTPDESYLMLRRLELLENAVINYSGGILNIEVRIRSVLNRNAVKVASSGGIDTEVMLLLKDIFVYLRDVKAHTELGDLKTPPLSHKNQIT